MNFRDLLPAVQTELNTILQRRNCTSLCYKPFYYWCKEYGMLTIHRVIMDNQIVINISKG